MQEKTHDKEQNFAKLQEIYANIAGRKDEKLIFVSNYFNHHQLSFCDALYELLKEASSLQTQPMEEERVKMGWQAEERPYVRYAKNSAVWGGENALSRTATPSQMRRF